MPKLSWLFAGMLVLTSVRLCAEEQPYAVPFEAGQTVEITLAKPYRTLEGVRVQATSIRLADKETFTLAAGGQEKTLAPSGERGRLQGALTAVDDAWLTLDLGEKQPLLRIPRVAVVRWETLALAAQGPAPLPLGQRIRFVSTDLGVRRLTGHIVAIDEDTLLLKVASRAEPLRVRRASIEQIEVPRGTHSGAATGAAIGGVSLGTAGAVLGLAVGAQGGDASWVGLAGAACGAGIGALIGGFVITERWERLPLSVAVAPQRRGGRAALTLRF
jgi:ribosome maturation factor RimP